jgi:hypothetical protein
MSVGGSSGLCRIMSFCHNVAEPSRTLSKSEVISECVKGILAIQIDLKSKFERYKLINYIIWDFLKSRKFSLCGFPPMFPVKTP